MTTRREEGEEEARVMGGKRKPSPKGKEDAVQ
jgi:hypothetical protein